jgi:hypothetical protein
MWWAMRELLDPAFEPDVAIPRDDQLIGELTAPKWDETASGKIKVESKEEIRKRLDRSTDLADAVLQTFASRESESEAHAEADGAGSGTTALLTAVQQFQRPENLEGFEPGAVGSGALPFGSEGEALMFQQWEGQF